MNEKTSAFLLSANIVGSLFYHSPRTSAARPVLDWLCADDAPASWPYSQTEAEELIARMAHSLADDEQGVYEEYNRLFVGPAALPAPPWGSVYTDPDSVIFGNETLEVRTWMREHGVSLNLPEREPEDQFGLMLLMLAWGLQHELPCDDAARFVEERMLPWANRFLELFVGGAAHSFYQSAGKLARLALKAWESEFGLVAPKRRLYR